MVEPRTTADIMRDLLAIVVEREWSAIYDGRCRCSGDCRCKTDGCAECGGYKDEDPRHENGCKVAVLIAEAGAYLRAEESECRRAEVPSPPLPQPAPGTLTPYRQTLADAGHCMADTDGDCSWTGCPQTVHYEGKGCPRWLAMRRRRADE